ncbi:MAG: hypothetical protein WAM92_15970 [Mycobacterium sp.]
MVDGIMVGYTASGSTIEEVEAAVISQCESAGAQQCTSDQAERGPLCIVSVGAGDGVVAGGAGNTVEEAFQDAIENSEEVHLELDPGPTILASSCA